MLNFLLLIYHSLKGDSPYMLKLRGLRIGKNFFLGGSIIDMQFSHLITIGDNVTLAGNGVTILVHDASTKRWLNYTKRGEVKIGNRVFIGAQSIILPDYIGDDVIIGVLRW